MLLHDDRLPAFFDFGLVLRKASMLRFKRADKTIGKRR
jgi:hypothetical protein